MSSFSSHEAEGSLTSLVKMSTSTESSVGKVVVQDTTTPAQDEWPKYLKMQQAGSSGASIIYNSGNFGDIELRLLADPGKKSAELMAHYLWDASLLMTQLIAGTKQHNHDPRWSVSGEHALELGAGSGLVGIICALAGAQKTVLTDFPDARILENIQFNVEANVTSRRSFIRPDVSVEAHKWGDIDSDIAKANAHQFTRVIATGCLWLPEQHRNIAKSAAHFLAKTDEAMVWLVSGFFLGRTKLAEFFDVAREEGLRVREVFEQDVVGSVRPWSVKEDHESRERLISQGWLMVAVFGNASSLP
ncbi:hypothetical protein OEA41_002007 [Lepraria neglecta]|uniref:Nicotinamide N-methyltransferase n=1 Tax=Lepraria neglecta TaxID=209136 RepID=A0AAD9ZBT5_9LECA|nr:hypothetical protein OEA41_002007 [Lepraria neglecta]